MRLVAPIAVLAAVAIVLSACGDSKTPNSSPTTSAATHEQVANLPSTSTESPKPVAKHLWNDRRHPRVDGYWRVAYIPIRTNDAAGVYRRYWQTHAGCAHGQCSFSAITRTKPHGVPWKDRLTFRLDRAIGDYRFTERGSLPCVNQATEAVVAAGGYRYVELRTLTVTTRRLRGDEWIATRMSGRDTTTWSLSSAAVDHNCKYEAPELYRMILVRLGSRP